MEYYQAYNGKEKVYETIYGDDVKSYSHLVWYINAIRETNPCSMIDFEYDPAKKQFQRIFILGCLTAATGINGDKGFFPLAMALVGSENNDNLEWFLRNLTQVNNFPITSSDPRYTLMLDHFQEATYALSPENHAKAIHKIKDLNCDWVADYIETILPESYVNAFFKGFRYGRTTSTLGDSFNSWILVHKKIPASALLDQISRKVMVMMANRRDDGANMMTPLTAKWRVYGFPCARALAAIRKIKREAIDFISPYFTSDYFRTTYLHAIHPIPNYNRHVDIDEDKTINPPIVKKQPGRPQGKRILSKGEKKVKRKFHCSNSKEPGHNRRQVLRILRSTHPLA
ncbi:uncharacterized protein LOC113359835 [Papaver somniferum]|uniref:uncharacterized protein LOC113359835 n=1 Tax=Papaver somniferum TaxID=3469 RepID=UPI000E6FBBEF|nr:uncharacterized protein LOC113359835 [Papaver somniferum]